MTVAPVQDLIVDVMTAADPASQRLAASRLERMTPATDQDFAATVDQKIEAAALEHRPASAAEDGTGSDGGAVLDNAASRRSSGRASGNSAVYRKFEAFILQMFVESMLPKDADDCSAKARPERSGDRCSPSRSATRWPRATGLELRSSWKSHAPLQGAVIAES